MSGASHANESPPIPTRDEPAFPNTTHVASREYRELVRSRIFHVSTITLTIIALIVALLPIAARFIERGGTTRIAVVASDTDLGERTASTLLSILNQNGGARFEVVHVPGSDEAVNGVQDHRYDAAIITARQPTGQIVTQVQLGETMGNDTLTQLTLGMFGVAVLDYASHNPSSGFQLPDTQILRAAGGGGNATVGASAYASRLIVGAVFGILIFLTIVIYGMWVAAGVVAEKSSRVMELLISAASPRQLVIGKALGIGLAGATQVAIVLAPAILVLLLEDRIASALLGPAAGLAPSLQALTPTLLGAFAIYYVLGFALYSLIYAAAGSLVSRPEDLQIIALPLSLIAILGYLQAILALTGGITWFIRLASYIPFWSPFVMLTRLAVGRVEPLELLVSVSILALTILVTAVIAIRIYGAGVLLYGQRPGLRAYVAAARHG